MEHKYVPLAEISNDTLEKFKFDLKVPEFKLAVTMHENLKRIGTDKDLKKSILIAICEVIVGHHLLYRALPTDQSSLDIPQDFGYSGQFEVDFSDPKTVRILNLFGGMKKIQRRRRQT